MQEGISGRQSSVITLTYSIKSCQRVEQLFHIKCYILTAGFFFLTVITWAGEEKLLEPKKASNAHKG